MWKFGGKENDVYYINKFDSFHSEQLHYVILMNRTRLNQSIESLSRNRKDTTKFKWCEKRFELIVVQEKVTKVLKVEQETKIMSYP